MRGPVLWKSMMMQLIEIRRPRMDCTDIKIIASVMIEENLEEEQRVGRKRKIEMEEREKEGERISHSISTCSL